MIPMAGLPQVVEVHDLEEARSLMQGLAVSAAGVDIMDKKALFRVVRLRGLDIRAANILKQEMLSRGGEVAISREVYELRGHQADCLIMGTVSQFERLLPKLKEQPFGLRAVGEALAAALKNFEQTEVSGPEWLSGKPRPLIMGVLNVTPDSFSDGGEFLDPGQAEERAWQMVEEGADLIDIGAESSRPWSSGIEAEVELERLLPVLRRLGAGFPIPISVDTSKARVAAAALEAGASMINDITALRGDPDMIAVVRDARCPVILMHMKGTPQNMQENPTYDDVVDEVFCFLAERIKEAVEQGIREEDLLIDPGIGFGKTVEHNLKLLRQLRSFRCLGRPVVLATSRKSFLGAILGLADPKERVIGTVATSALAAVQGVDILRVHDVKENVQAVAVARAVGAGAWSEQP